MSLPTIIPDCITEMKGLESRPVYFVKLFTDQEWTLVVKMDAKNRQATETTDDAAISIKWGSKLMRHVNTPTVKTKIMTPEEIEIFKNAARLVFDTNSEQYKNLDKIGPVFVKMPFVRGLNDADFYNEKAKKYDNTLAKKTVRKFSDEAVWRDLGQVVAVDLFIGNNDRFSSSGEWVNKGNVMFLENRVIGLDTFDYNSGIVSNLKTGGGFDALRILIDNERRTAYAKQCARSVGEVLKGRLKAGGARKLKIMTEEPTREYVEVDVSTMEKLFDPYADNFEQGLRIGAAELKLYLQGLVRKYAQEWERAAPQQGPQVGQRPQQGLQIGQRPQQGPQIGQRPHQGPPVLPQAPLPGQQGRPPAKTIPQGILDRMAYLGWNV